MIAIVAGRGRLGTSLHGALVDSGLDSSLVGGRDLSDLRALLAGSGSNAIVFLAVPDPAIQPTAAALATNGPPPGAAFVHLSGAYGLGPLQPLHSLGNPVGAFHPLQSFPAKRGPEAFHGSIFGMNASTADLSHELGLVAGALGGTARVVGDADRPLYHAAAVVASNYLNSLVLEATLILEAIGWSRTESIEALVPLVRGALENIAARGLPDALIGPIRRGDPVTVARHLAALEVLAGRSGERTRELYRLLGEDALELASEAGLEPPEAAAVAVALGSDPARSPRLQPAEAAKVGKHLIVGADQADTRHA